MRARAGGDVPPLISDAHVIVDRSDAEADRKFLRDVVGLELVDVAAVG